MYENRVCYLNRDHDETASLQETSPTHTINYRVVHYLELHSVAVFSQSSADHEELTALKASRVPKSGSFGNMTSVETPQLPGTLSSIHKAVCDPHLSLDTVEAILWEDPSCLNSANPQNGFTPLHAAARRAHSGLIKLLIKSGADLEAKWRGGETAFLMACKVSCSLPVSSLPRSQVPSNKRRETQG